MPQPPDIFVYSRILNPVENYDGFMHCMLLIKPIWTLDSSLHFISKALIFHPERGSRGEEKYIPATLILCPNNLQDGHEMDKAMTARKTITKNT